MLYTAKGFGALLVPIASVIAAHYGWRAVFMVTVGFNVTAAVLALFALRFVAAGATSPKASSCAEREAT